MHQLYTKTTHTINGAHPRSSRYSTILPSDRLQIVYNRFQSPDSYLAAHHNDGRVLLNLIFAHGNGMNKAVHDYHIHKLFAYQQVHASKINWKLNVVISHDAANHGDSAMLNKGKLGTVFQWVDNARDLLEIISHEDLHFKGYQFSSSLKATEKTSETLTNAKLIGIGHSFGAVSVLFANFLNPSVFESIVAVDPVIFQYADKANSDYYSHGKITGHASIEHAKRYQMRLSKPLKNKFGSKEEMVEYFTKVLHFRKFHPGVIGPLVDNEVSYVDPVNASPTRNINDSDNDDKKAVYCKTTREQQLAIYAAGDKANVQFHQIAPLISPQLGKPQNSSVPITLIHGTNRGTIFNKKFYDLHYRKLLTNVELREIKGGTHLVIGEMPDHCVDEYVRHLNNRSKVLAKLNEGQSGDKNNLYLTIEERAEVFRRWFNDFEERAFLEVDYVPFEYEDKRIDNNEKKISLKSKL